MPLAACWFRMGKAQLGRKFWWALWPQFGRNFKHGLWWNHGHKQQLLQMVHHEPCNLPNLEQGFGWKRKCVSWLGPVSLGWHATVAQRPDNPMVHLGKKNNPSVGNLRLCGVCVWHFLRASTRCKVEHWLARVPRVFDSKTVKGFGIHGIRCQSDERAAASTSSRRSGASVTIENFILVYLKRWVKKIMWLNVSRSPFRTLCNYSLLVACLTHLCNLQDSRPQRASKLEISKHFVLSSGSDVVCSGQRMLATHYLGTCDFETVFASAAATLAFLVARSHQHDGNLGWTDHGQPDTSQLNSENFKHGREW